LWGGECHEAHVRHAALGDAIYLDLADRDWRAVEITAAGWRLVSDPPVRFRRTRGMAPLPEPESGGSVSELRPLLNVDDEGWKLVVGFAVGAMAPAGPYPVLSFVGEAGTAKSTAARLIRSAIDPNLAPLRSEPRDERDLNIAATNSRVIAIDNVSRLRDWLSDALCRLATGAGFATRELFSDCEETILATVRPTILTSIGEVTTRGDLADRSLIVTLQPIEDRQRLTEAELEARWKKIHPRVLGGLLDTAACALANRDEVRLDRLPRLADHARWVTAAESRLGWKSGTYLGAYDKAREHAALTTLDDSPVTAPLLKIAAGGFNGTATELLSRLEAEIEDERITKRSEWPKSPSSLSAKMRGLAPQLRVTGIEIVFPRSKTSRAITIRAHTEQKAEKPSPASRASLPASDSQISGDVGDGLRDEEDGVVEGAKRHVQTERDAGDDGDGISRKVSRGGDPCVDGCK
jgi:hypothetical protein